MSSRRTTLAIALALVCGAGSLAFRPVSRATSDGPRHPALAWHDTAEPAPGLSPLSPRRRSARPAAPPFQPPARNPFVFAPTPQPRSRAVGSAPVPVAETAARAPKDTEYTLVGIAESRDGSTVTRSAIFTGDDGQVVILRTGEPLTATERMGEIRAESVTLTNNQDATTRQLSLF